MKPNYPHLAQRLFNTPLARDAQSAVAKRSNARPAKREQQALLAASLRAADTGRFSRAEA